MKNVRFWIVAGAMLTLPTTGVAQASGRYEVSGERVAVYNLAGTLAVEGGRGSAVVVDIDARGPDRDALAVETGPVGGVQSLRVIYPDDRIVYGDMTRRSRTQFRVRDDGTFFGRSDGRRSRGTQVTISGSGRGLEAHADMTITVPVGAAVDVYLGVGEVRVTNVEGELYVDVASAPVVARGVRGTLSVDTGSGSVEVTDVRGDLDVDTGSGSVDVNGVVGRMVRVDTGSGSVRGGNITANAIEIDTGSGRIEMDAVDSPAVNLDTGSGSVRVDLVSDVDMLRIDTGSGRVTVAVPADIGAQVDVESSSGGVDFDMPVTVRQFDRNSLRGSIGDGRGTINVETGSGSIRFIRRGR